MTRDLVIKPLDYPPYISIHYEDESGGHDFTIDPPLDSPAYIAKFSPEENQFACGSDFRIDRTQVFGSPGVLIPTKGFRLFFFSETFLLMGGYIGQPPIMFQKGSRSYNVYTKFPVPTDGSYFTYGTVLTIGKSRYLALCNSATSNIVDLYLFDSGSSFVKYKSIDVGSTVKRLFETKNGFYAAFADSYVRVDVSSNDTKVGTPVKAKLHAVEPNILGEDTITLITSHDKNVYYKTETTDESVLLTLQPNFDFVIQTMRNSNSRGKAVILVCVYYRSATILCDPVYYALDISGIVEIPKSNITWNTSDKRDIGFTIQNENLAAGPYGLYKKDTYDSCKLGTMPATAYKDTDGKTWITASGSDAITKNNFIAHDDFMYVVGRELNSATNSYVNYCAWQTYTTVTNAAGKNIPTETGYLTCPDHPDGRVPIDKDDNLYCKHRFTIRNSSLFAFGVNNDGANYLFDLKDHLYKCLFNTNVSAEVNKDRPDLTQILDNNNDKIVSYTYSSDLDAMVSATRFKTKDGYITIRVDFFDKKDGTFSYSSSHFIDTNVKVFSKAQTSLEAVRNYGMVVAILGDTPLMPTELVYKCTKDSHILINNNEPNIDQQTNIKIFRYLPKSDCFVIVWNKDRYSGISRVYELVNDTLIYKHSPDTQIYNDANFNGDFVTNVYKQASGPVTNTLWVVSLQIIKITKKYATISKYDTNFSYRGPDTVWYSSNCAESASNYNAMFITRTRSGINDLTYRCYVVYTMDKVGYPYFRQYLPFTAENNEVFDSVSIDETVNLTNQSSLTGRHLMPKNDTLVEMTRFPAEENYSADHVFNVSYSPSNTFVIYQNPDGMNLGRRKTGGSYVNISKKSLTFVDGYNATLSSITEKDFETHPLHTKLSNFVYGTHPSLFTYLALPATDQLEAGVPDVSNGVSADEPLSPYGRRIIRTDGKNFYRIYYDWNKNMVKSNAAFDSGEVYLASTYMRSGAESDIVLYLIASDKATPPDAHGVSDLGNAFTVDRKPVKFGPVDFSVCDVVVVAHGRDKDTDQPFTFFKLDRTKHTLTDMHISIPDWNIDSPILDVKFLDCDRMVVVTNDEAILLDTDSEDEKKKKIKDRIKLKKGGVIKKVDKNKFKVDGNGDGSGMGGGGSGFGAGNGWLKPEFIVEALSINIFYRD